ncbi:MAG TPA: hypothetical protein VHJ83_06070 [Micromonosporaceae bacterium]|nr:hypothetical protein [Micromonosporaceae bacterium]
MLGRTKERATPKGVGGELHEGFDHLRSAASLAAERTAERIAPAVDSARTNTRELLLPRVEHAREAASRAWESRMMKRTTPTMKNAKKMSRRDRRKAARAGMLNGMATGRLGRRTRGATVASRPPRRGRWMLGALGVGAAVGAISAMVRRRKAPEWQEYEPMERGDAPKVTEMDTARRRTGTVTESGPGPASGTPAGEPGAGLGESPTVEPSSVRTPDERPPGI